MKMNSLFENTKTSELNEAFNVPGIEEHGVGDVIKQSLIEIMRFHVFHWNAKSYSKHQAVGEFYEKLNELVDELAEKYVGAGGMIDGIIAASINIDRLDENRVRASLRNLRRMVANSIDSTGSDSRLMSVNDSLVQILNLIDHTEYKCDLM